MQGLPGNTLFPIPSVANPSTNNTDKEVATSPPSLLSNYAWESSNNEQVMLSTAVVLICGSDGSRRACRALLDCGSQANFVTTKFVEALGLETRPTSLSICGVNDTSTNHVVGIILQSRLNSYTASIECIITDRITGKIPTFSLGRDKFNLPRNIRLADPRFHISSDIDFLIGADLFWNLIWSNQVFEQTPNSPKNWAGFWRVVWTAPHQPPQRSTRFTRT